MGKIIEIFKKNKIITISIILITLIVAISGTTVGILLARKNNKIYTIQFESAGGSKIENQILHKGEKVIRPEDPIKEGFDFIDWNLNGEVYNFENIISEDIILTAKWKAKEGMIIYKVSFDSAGGSVVEPIEVAKGNTVTEPIQPKKQGYSFKGWYFNENLFDFSFGIVEDIQLIARWEEGEGNDIEYSNKNINSSNNINNVDIVINETTEFSTEEVDNLVKNLMGNWYYENDSDVYLSINNAYILGETRLNFSWNSIDLYGGKIYPNDYASSIYLNYPIESTSIQNLMKQLHIKGINNSNLTIDFSGKIYKFVRTRKEVDLSKYNEYVGTWYLIGGDNTDNIVIQKESGNCFRITLYTADSAEYISAEGITQKNINENQTIFDKYGITYSNNKLVVNRNSQTKIYSRNKEEVSINLEDFEIDYKSTTGGNTIKIGATIQYIIKPKPIDASNITGKWYSEDSSIATVDDNGLAKGISKGTTKIFFKSNEKNITKFYYINVEAIKTEKIDLEETSITMHVGDRKYLNYSVYPNNATNKDVEFSTSNSIIKMENNYIVATDVGTVKLIIESKDRNSSTTCEIKVLPKAVEGIQLNKSSDTVYVGKTTNLTANVLPNNATNKNVIWSSSDSNIATVNSKGVVTGKNEGTAIITAKTEDGSYTASCTVNVNYMKLTVSGEIAFTTKITNNTYSSGIEVTAKPSGGTGNYTSYNIKLYYNGNLIGEGTSNSLFVNQRSNGTYKAVITVTDSKGNTASTTSEITKS